MKKLTDRQFVLLSKWVNEAEVHKYFFDGKTEKEYLDTQKALYRLHKIAEKKTKVLLSSDR